MTPAPTGCGQEALQVLAGRDQQSLDVGIHEASFDFSGVKVQLPAPHEARFLAQIDNLLEETLENGDAQPVSDAGQTGVVRECLVQRIAEIPAMRQVEAGRRDELAFGANPLEEHNQLQ